MIKGCQKNIIFLKNTGSELFDEAYFVVKPSATQKKERDIVLEASRLINGLDDTKMVKKAHRLLPFALGLLLGGGAVLLFCMILI